MPVDLVHGLDGGGEENRSDDPESKEKYPWGEMKISVSATLSYLHTEDFPDLQSWFEPFIDCS